MRTEEAVPAASDAATEVETADQLCTAAGAGERRKSVNSQGDGQSNQGGHETTSYTTITKANYKSALTNPVFQKVFRSISGISNGNP